MAAITVLPTSNVNTPVAIAGMWNHSLCECNDCNLCCEIIWCTPCMIGRLHSSVIDDRDGRVNACACGTNSVAEYTPNVFANLCLGPIVTEPVCAALFLASLTLSFIPCCWMTHLRMKMREKYSIEGNSCEDCCVASCCGLCTMCQMHHELTTRNRDAGFTCCRPAYSRQPVHVVVAAQPTYSVGYTQVVNTHLQMHYDAPVQGMPIEETKPVKDESLPPPQC